MQNKYILNTPYRTFFWEKPQSSSASMYKSLKRERFELLRTEMQSVRGCQSVAAFRSILSPSLIWLGARARWTDGCFERSQQNAQHTSGWRSLGPR